MPRITYVLPALALTVLLAFAVTPHAAAESESSRPTAAAQSDAGSTRQRDLSFKRACDARNNAIRERLINLDRRAKRHIETLSAITARVEAFKEKKHLTVANYDSLVAAIDADNASAASLLEPVAQAMTFECGSSKAEAKASLAAFKTAMQQEVAALQKYRSDVKALITAVKAAAQAPEASND